MDVCLAASAQTMWGMEVVKVGMASSHDVVVVRELAKQYREVAEQPIQEEKRRLWTDHLGLRSTRPPVMIRFGLWNAWCRHMFADAAMTCQDGFWRQHERELRLMLFRSTIGDDYIMEPWYDLRASMRTHPDGVWGVSEGRIGADQAETTDGSWAFDPPIKDWDDVRKLISPHHVIDEAQTADNLARLQDAIGDIITINLDRSPQFVSFEADISMHLARLRGLEQVMYDMSDSPDQLHALLAFMRDSILAVQSEGEKAGDFNLANQRNQVMCYAPELEPPCPNANGRRRRDIWYHCAAQEMTLISPRMFEEFMLRYQQPIIENFGLAAYGCCENLTDKIHLLRCIRNLRMIAVTPVADVRRCAEQIGAD